MPSNFYSILLAVVFSLTIGEKNSLFAKNNSPANPPGFTIPTRSSDEDPSRPEETASLQSTFFQILYNTKLSSMQVILSPKIPQIESLFMTEETSKDLFFLNKIFSEKICYSSEIALPTGILLHGPSGCGKKSIAKCLAVQLDASIIHVNGSDISNSYLTKGQLFIRNIFALAKILGQMQKQRVVVLIDNFEQICPASSKIPTIEQEVALFDELKSLASLEEQYVLFAGVTNFKDQVNPTVFEHNKIGITIEVTLPCKKVREQIILSNILNKSLAVDIDVEKVVEKTHGFSVQNIFSVISDALWIASKNSRFSAELKDVEDAIEKIKKQLREVAKKEKERIEATNSTPGERKSPLPAKYWEPGSVKERFDDVIADDEVKQEITDLVEFIKNPEKFRKIGAKVPGGVLLYGPTGTGKTLFAKALAGEAGCGFFSVTSPALTSTYIGDSAKNMRRIFEAAREKDENIIIFFDECDSFACTRGRSHGSLADDNRQMLEQLFCELDGFDERGKIFVIAATNADISNIDRALLRPGRIDRHVYMGLPSKVSRSKIIERRAKDYSLDESVNLEELSNLTYGFSGADVGKIFNEAAISCAKNNKQAIRQEDLITAKVKVSLGVPNRSMMVNQEELVRTAYHESGHTLLAYLMKGSYPVKYVTIIPRGSALGVTLTSPDQDTFNHNKNELLADISIFYGGMIAEEMFFNEHYTGIHNDLAKACKIALQLVYRYGMSSLKNQAFFDNDREAIKDSKIRTECESILTLAEEVARKILADHRFELLCLAQELLKKETLNREEIKTTIEKARCLKKFFKSMIKKT